MLRLALTSTLTIALTTAILGCASAQASDYHSPKTAALGGAGHASPALTDAIYLNPAATSFVKTYNIHVGFNSYHGPDDTEPKGRVFGVSLLDGRNEWFQAGLGYARRAEGAVANLGASKSFMEKFGVGLGSKYFFRSDRLDNAGDVSASVIGEMSPNFALSFMVDNVVAADKIRAWGVEREYILGIKYSFDRILTFYVDPHLVPGLPGSGFGYEVGAELQVMSDLYARIGKSKQAMQPHLGEYGRGFGWGLGWMAPKISLDFAIHKTFEPVDTINTVFSGTIIY